MQLLEGEKEEILACVKDVLGGNSKTQENLIPILQQVQKKLGYLPTMAIEKIAEGMDVPAVDIYGLATFYNQFRLNPPGKHEVKVCMGTACYMAGGDITLESFQRRMEIDEGETSQDRYYSLGRVACVGCCTLAPVAVVDDQVEGKVTPTRVDGLMLALEEGRDDNSSQQPDSSEGDNNE